MPAIRKHFMHMYFGLIAFDDTKKQKFNFAFSPGMKKKQSSAIWERSSISCLKLFNR